MRRVLTCLATLALVGPAVAACTSDWSAPTEETMAVSDGTRFRITRFANEEVQVSVAQPAQSFDFFLTAGALVVKGIPAAQLPAFEQEFIWWALFSAPTSTVVYLSVRGDPCTVAGTFDIDMRPSALGGQHPDFKLLRAKGNAVADGQGRIRSSVRFDTEPALPPDRLLTYTGMMSFVTQGDALPGGLDVGGFNVIARDKPAFVAAPGTTLSQLRAQLVQTP